MVTCAATALVEGVEHVLLGFNIIFNLRRTPQDMINPGKILTSSRVVLASSEHAVQSLPSRHAGQCAKMCAGNESVVA